MGLYHTTQKINKGPQTTKIEHVCTHIVMKGIMQD